MIGTPELIIIIIVTLVLLGPEKIPELVKAIKEAYIEYKKAVLEAETCVDEKIKREKYEEDRN